MIKVKDGYAKLVGTTASGSASHILLSNGDVKAVSDFALADGTNATGTWNIDISGNAKSSTQSKYLLTGAGTECDANTLAFSDHLLRWYSSIPSTSSNLPTVTGWQNGLLALPLHSNGVTAQLYFSATKALFYRSMASDNWNQIAYTTSDITGNANTASKLQNKVKIWGQDFDGSKDVNGVLTTNAYITFNKTGSELGYIGLASSKNDDIYVSSSGNLYINGNEDTYINHAGGNVGIGTTNPKYKLDVNGVIRANGNILLEAANSTTGGGIAFWDASGWINGTINAKNLILNYAGGNVGVGILSPKAKLHVNGDTLINKRLIIGQDLGVWDSSRAELELISPSGQAIDFWMGSGQRDWSISSRTSEESNALKFFSCTSDTITTTTLTLEKSGNMYLYGNLHIGKSDTRNYIAFRGTTGDDQVLHQNTFIGENHFGGTESSELILFKGNDFGTHATSLSTSGPDRIRYIAAAHLFQIYKSALSGTFADICTSTVPVNMLAIHQDSIQTYAPLVIVGEKYSGNYGINMQNSDIVGINAMYTQDNAEDGGEGLQFSRGNGYYDSIWASSGTLYFSPNGNLNRAGSYSTNYTVIHSGNYSSYALPFYTKTSGDCNSMSQGLTVLTAVASNQNGGNHSAFLTITSIGTPFQLQIPDSSEAYIYKRCKSGSSWSAWSKLSAGYADSAGSVAWGNITGKPSSFTPASHNHNGSYVSTGGMVNGAYAVIPTYNGETGWHRIATIDGGTGYGSWILYLCGDWSWASNTNAILHINTMHTTARITQVSGIVGFATDVRLVPISANNYYVDVYINYSGANTPGTVYCYFLGNGAITTRTTVEKITASVSTAASITLVTGTKTNDSSYAAHFYENSDIRYKTIINNLAIKANQLANLPLFDFKWQDNEDQLNTGTSAQAVQELLPYIVSGTDKLTLDYGVLGTIAGITACRELTEQEKEINKLKEQIKFLKDEINNLKTNKLWQS